MKQSVFRMENSGVWGLKKRTLKKKNKRQEKEEVIRDRVAVKRFL